MDELTAIVQYISTDDPEAARRVASVIFDRVMRLRHMPFRGRLHIAGPGRELVFAPWPYIAVDDVSDDRIEVLAIRHTSQQE